MQLSCSGYPVCPELDAIVAHEVGGLDGVPLFSTQLVDILAWVTSRTTSLQLSYDGLWRAVALFDRGDEVVSAVATDGSSIPHVLSVLALAIHRTELSRDIPVLDFL